MKRLGKRLIENLKIIGIAFVLAIVIFIVVKRPDLFSASVLLLQDRQTIEANQRDIGYKNSDNLLDVFIAEQLKKFDSLDFTITMDPDTVSIDFSAIESQLPFEISNPSNDGFVFHLTHANDIDYDQSLFMIPFVGDMPYILVSEGSRSYKSKNTGLAIGNLEDYKEVHQQ